MDKNQIALALEDDGFKFDENKNLYCLEGYDDIFVGIKENDETCLFWMGDGSNTMEIPVKYIKTIRFCYNMRLKSIHLILKTLINTYISIKFMSSMSYYCKQLVKDKLKFAIWDIKAEISDMEWIVDNMKDPFIKEE